MTSPAPTLFIDRDGTLVEETADERVDSFAKLRFMPGVFCALAQLRRRGFRFVMVTNQDGLGTPELPREKFDPVHQFILETFHSQGIEFDAIFICPHYKSEGCECRKPGIGLVRDYLQRIDPRTSAMIGDRDTDIEFAHNIGVQPIRVRIDGTLEETWPAIARRLSARTATVERQTRETKVTARVGLDATDPVRIGTGIGFFDHMLEQLARHGGFSLQLDCEGDLRIDEHHTVEDCALTLGEALRAALGTKAGIGRYGFVLPMDESRAAVTLDLSGRPFAKFEGRFDRDSVGGLPTELVPHFFRSLAESMGAALHVSVTGDNAHHMIEACFKASGRALRQALHREGEDLPSTKGML